jgi:hypothetical protein
MDNDSEYIHRPIARPLPEATPDIEEILYRCFNEKMSPEEALVECQRFGVKNLSVNDVQMVYQDCVKATRLQEDVVQYLRQKNQRESKP